MAEINLNDLFTSLAPTTEAKAELLRQHYLKQKELTIDRQGKEWQEIANQASQKLRDNDYPAFTALSGEVIAMKARHQAEIGELDALIEFTALLGDPDYYF